MGWLCAISPCLLCVLGDYVGLSAIMPVLPFHCRDKGWDVNAWAGSISSAQFGAVMIACIIMGRVADRLGAKRAVQLAMAGNVVTFLLSAWAPSPGVLLAVRFGAGLCSPLVPALAYIFETVPLERVVHGTSAYMLAVVVGMQCGAGVVGLYDRIGWLGIALLSSGISLLGLVSTLPMLSARRGPDRPRPLHVRRALRSRHFVTHASVAFSIGFSFTTCFALLPVVLMEQEWAASRVSLVAFALALPTGAAALLSPALTRRCGVQGVITGGLLVQVVCLLALCAPSCARNPAALITLCVVVQFAVFSEQPPNNSRAKTIGQHLTSGGTGTVTGWSRFVFSAGLAAGPVASLALHGLAVWAPWAAAAAVQVAALAAHPLCGVSLTSDHVWTTGVVSARTAGPVKVGVVAVEPGEESC